MHKVALLPGDGIGPEITAAAIRVIESAGVQSDRKRNLDLVLQ
jgi:isocitrate/isopropylmalate dehydrogenase